MTEFRYTPSGIEAIRVLARTMSAPAIAAHMKCPVSTVLKICKDHGIYLRGKDFAMPDVAGTPREPKVTKSMEIIVDKAMLVVVRREAVRRGLDTHTLIERLVEKIAADGLFGAVLDQ